MLARGLFALTLCVFGLVFAVQEKIAGHAEPYLAPAMPTQIQRVALGYMQQLGAEMLFVRAAVFLGGLPAGVAPESYAATLAQNFDVMTELYPRFVDPYYLAQSSLPHISPEYAAQANTILARGMKAVPEHLILPFFAGFNYFHYMEQPQKAAEVFFEMAQRPEAPTWLGHLAAVLAAQGGNLYGGRLTLEAMLASEEDEIVRERYQRSLEAFDKAIVVFEATSQFEKDHGYPPDSLGLLVPNYLQNIPDLGTDFEMVWEPPTLRLVRSKK